MRRLTSALLTALFVVTCSLPAYAQQKRVSPHETINANIDRNRVVIVYGRPYSKDPKSGEIRKIWGGLLGTDSNPWGHPWRAGSDEATIFATVNPIILGGTPIPAGAYTLFLVPNEDGSAKLVINKQVGEWGIPYTPMLQKSELARVDMTKGSVDPRIDQFTITIKKAPEGGGVITMAWENTSYSVNYTVQK